MRIKPVEWVSGTVVDQKALVSTTVRWLLLRSSQSLPGESADPTLPDLLLLFNEKPEIQFFNVKSLDFEILATYSNILKTVWSKQNSSAGYIQPTGCQIETSVLDNILMDEDNSFIACDHSSWEFPTEMN